MRECIIFENLEPSGMVKFPLCTANVLSPKGKVKKHNRYSKQPRACNIRRNTGPIMMNEFSGINTFFQNIRPKKMDCFRFPTVYLFYCLLKTFF